EQMAGPAAGGWPPENSVAMDLDELYQRLGEGGLEYGPAFEGLRAAWRRGEEVFAEVELPEDLKEQAGRFALHPALLDAALHPAVLVSAELAASDTPSALAPFRWEGVGLGGAGASAARVTLTHGGEGNALSATLFEESGRPIARIGSLSLRELPR